MNINVTKPIQYIPAGSEIVYTGKNGSHTWYETKKDIPVENPTTVQCPVRDIPVLSQAYMGYTVYFLEGQVRDKVTSEQEQAAINLCLYKLEYDIPAEISRRGTVEHPSSYMWERGVRTSGSMWLVPKGNIPWIRLRELTRAGCIWEVTKVDVTEAVASVQKAIAQLRKELIAARQRNAESLASAEERFTNGTGSEITRTRRRIADIKRAEKALKEAVENVANGAKALGIPQYWVEYSNTRHVSRIVNENAHAEAENVGAVVDAANALGTAEGKVIAEAVANNTMPADIAKDYLQENGVYNLTDNLEDGENDETED